MLRALPHAFLACPPGSNGSLVRFWDAEWVIFGSVWFFLLAKLVSHPDLAQSSVDFNEKDENR